MNQESAGIPALLLLSRENHNAVAVYLQRQPAGGWISPSVRRLSTC
jgi:hypothetical protein